MQHIQKQQIKKKYIPLHSLLIEQVFLLEQCSLFKS